MHLRFLFAFAPFFLSTAPVSAQSVTRVSVDSKGLQGADFSATSAVSGRGRYVAFASLASTFVPGDTNGKADIFVYDRSDGTTTRVSVSSTGTESDADALGPYLSESGRYVAFRSDATNLVPGDTNGESDVFVHDRSTGTTVRASVSTLGVEGNHESYYTTLSADGRYVCFVSEATNLVPNDTNEFPLLLIDGYDVFVRDLMLGTTERVNLSTSGAEGNHDAYDAAISADGRFVAFSSRASNVVPGDTNGRVDLFLRDRTAGTTELVSVSLGGAPGNSDSELASISSDGRFVVFTSHATDLVSGDTNGLADVFVRDMLLGTTERISVSSAGAQADAPSTSYYTHPVVSADGRFVVFESAATTLSAGDTNGVGDVFLRDRTAGTTTRISTSSAGVASSGASRRGTLSPDGRYVAFECDGAGLVAGDTNSSLDVFLYDRLSLVRPIESYCTAKTNSLGCTPAIGATGEPTLTGTDAFFLTATNVLGRARGTFLWSTSPAALPFAGGTLCVQGAVVRTPVQRAAGNAGTCGGTYSFRMDALYVRTAGLAPGTVVYAQCFSRDPGFAAPNDVGLTDGVRFTIAP